MDEQLIGRWMVWQTNIGEMGRDPYFVQSCQGWAPALMVTHAFLMTDIEKWLAESGMELVDE